MASAEYNELYRAAKRLVYTSNTHGKRLAVKLALKKVDLLNRRLEDEQPQPNTGVEEAAGTPGRP